ncbi:MAG: quinol dehydrogenase ferredoxin subunit NapH [Hyphomicrobiaceae bacterium]|nr:MAG: quinol dehydrogenase ferredoxin subunit NapH [Hyphomicrobiaceae bacterium]
MTASRTPGREARARHGVLVANRWLIARRLAQLGFFLLFASGPWFGLWIAKGTLAASLTLDVLPLTDPLVLLQSLLARHVPELTALIGAGIVLAVYLVLGGRLYCSWVCPINAVTDLALFARHKLGIETDWKVKPQTRLWLLAAVLAASAISGTIAFELVNPITMLYRNLLFGLSWGLLSVLVIFLFDLFAAKHGWCGHVCPVGAFYGVLNHTALVRVSAVGRDRCDDCMDCYAICPEMHVISPALKSAAKAASPVILSADCTACGRCIDVCPERVFRLTYRADVRAEQTGGQVLAGPERKSKVAA